MRLISGLDNSPKRSPVTHFTLLKTGEKKFAQQFLCEASTKTVQAGDIYFTDEPNELQFNYYTYFIILQLLIIFIHMYVLTELWALYSKVIRIENEIS